MIGTVISVLAGVLLIFIAGFLLGREVGEDKY